MVAAESSGSMVAAPDTKLGRVLIVDDDEQFCAVIERYLGRLGYEVVTAHTGAAGLDQMESGDYDVALLDVQLPDANGHDMLVAFKDRLPDAAAIMMTAEGSLDIVIDSIRSGASDFITKPFPLELLKTSLERAFERRPCLAVAASGGTGAAEFELHQCRAGLCASQCPVFFASRGCQFSVSR